VQNWRDYGLVGLQKSLSVKQLTKRINQATKQVRLNLKSLPENASWGFVAISFSNLLGTEHSEVVVVKDRKEALDRLSSAIDALIARRQPGWQWSREAQGVIFHAKAPLTNNETDRIEFGAFFQIFGAGPVCEALVKIIGHKAVH
jgi:hypothetical protein